MASPKTLVRLREQSDAGISQTFQLNDPPFYHELLGIKTRGIRAPGNKPSVTGLTVAERATGIGLFDEKMKNQSTIL